ncbi:DDE-domain-containing protein [Mycena venus]|uniref:DDE-domain-containing protein n=1 Tax=Mycena venus TaxID=2733690 RepID=A0A8H6X8T8_9AGAR|nr:DDE-domain-containing protein [Mycena venus]
MLEGPEKEIMDQILAEKKIDKSVKLALEKKLPRWEKKDNVIYVPWNEELRDKIIGLHHNNPLLGHPGENQRTQTQGTPSITTRVLAERNGVDKERLAPDAPMGGRGITEMNEKKQRLTPKEERVVLDHILMSADRGFPMKPRMVVQSANEILKSRGAETIDPESNWVHRFLERHCDELQMHWSKPLDSQRAQSLNPKAVEEWYKLVKELLPDQAIRVKDIYGMDESGFPPSDQGKQRVIGQRGAKIQHKQGGADMENVTAIITICADGTKLTPTIIFKGKNFLQKYGENNIAGASICISENGWTDNEIALEWLMKDFEPQTREKAGGRTRVLILDGHSSHHTAKFLKFAQEHNIIVLDYPPHCTHALQGLDAVCFARMKVIWKEEINQFEEKNRRKVRKADFTGLFGRAYLWAFTESTVKAAFRVTGIYPFNPNVIKPEQMKPAEATSTKGGFPLLQPSPVRAVMAALHHNPPTAFAVDPDTFIPVGGSVTPQCRSRDPNIDPALYTPSKRMRFMTSALTTTSSGSFLVSKDLVTSKSHLPDPVLEGPPTIIPQLDLGSMELSDEDLERMSKHELLEATKMLRQNLGLANQHIAARDGIIESAHATIVLQNVFCERQSEALNAKEQKKKSNHVALSMGGLGRHLTALEWIEQTELAQKARDDEIAVKEKRAEGREAA